MKSILQQVGNKIARKFRLSRVAQRFFQEQQKKGQTLGYFSKVDNVVEVRTLCRMSNSEAVQRLLKRTWNLLARNLGTCTNTSTKPKDPRPGTRQTLPTTEQNNPRDSRRTSAR